MTSNSEQKSENVVSPSASPNTTSGGGGQQVVMSDIEYLDDPSRAFAAMRQGATVVVEPTISGGIRMVLSGQPLSAISLDEPKS